MVINVIDHVAQCQTYADGMVIAGLIKAKLQNDESIVLSFRGVNAVPSSFVNAAFVSLLSTYSAEVIRRRVQIRDSTQVINSLIKERVAKESAGRHVAWA